MDEIVAKPITPEGLAASLNRLCPPRIGAVVRSTLADLGRTRTLDVLALMLSLVREAGASLLMVTHSMRLADQLDGRVHLKSGRVV